MPVSRNYNGGSIVFFQGDRSEDVYVLQKGRVILTSTAIDTGEEVKQDVQKGEFFGVKSTLGHFPREETAQVLGATTLLVFKQAEFEKLVLINTRLIMKMLRVFSKQLRDVHRQVRDVLKTGAAREPSFELMNVAESFYRSGHIDHAVYGFTMYMEHYPSGKYANRSQELLNMARQGQMYPSSFPNLAEIARGDDDASIGNDIVNRGMMPAEQTLDDPFALDMGAPSDLAASSGPGAEDLYYQGMDAFSKQEYDRALELYDQAIDASSASPAEESDIAAKSVYEKARVLMKLSRLDDAATTLSAYLKQYPTGENMKDAIFQMGVISESKGNKDRARTLYRKVATMPPKDSTSSQAHKRLERLG